MSKTRKTYPAKFKGEVARASDPHPEHKDISVQAHKIKISMDGKGRWMDNVFIERLWRSLKYECVYLNAFDDGLQARRGIGRWLAFYNAERPHSAFDGQTPDEVYYGHQNFVPPVSGYALRHKEQNGYRLLEKGNPPLKVGPLVDKIRDLIIRGEEDHRPKCMVPIKSNWRSQILSRTMPLTKQLVEDANAFRKCFRIDWQKMAGKRLAHNTPMNESQ